MADNSSMENSRRGRFVLFLIVLITLVSVGYVVYQNLGLKNQYSVSEARALAGSLEGKPIAIQARVGRIVLESVKNPPVQLWLSDGQNELAITYQGYPYEGLAAGDNVLVSGSLTDSETFTATRLVLLDP